MRVRDAVNPLYWLGLSGKPTVAQTPEATGSELITLEEEERQSSGPNAVANAVSGRGLVNLQNPSGYLSSGETQKLNESEERQPKNLVTILELTQLALDRKNGLSKVENHNLEKVLFKDLEPYFTSGYKPYDKNSSLEQAIRMASSNRNIEHLLLAACKLRISEIANREDYKRESITVDIRERVISHTCPGSGETILWKTLTLEKALSDLTVFERRIEEKIAKTRSRFQEK